MSKTREQLDKELLELQNTAATQTMTLTPASAVDGQPPTVVVTPEPVVTPPPVVEAPAVDKSVEDLKAQLAERDARLAELQAKMDKQSGDYGGNLDRVRNQLREVTDAYARLTADFEAAKTKTVQPPPPPAKVVTDDMRSTFPEAADAIEQTIAALRAELAAVKKIGEEGSTRAQRAEQSSVQVAEARFNESLYGQVPDFDALNASPAWKDFVETPDQYGRTLKGELQNAWNSFNPKLIIEAVKSFKASTAKTPTAEEAAAKASAEAAKAARLKAEAAPSTAAGVTKKDPGPEDIAKMRQARISAYKAKFARDFNAVTPEETAQNRKDQDEELSYKLSRSG